LIIFIEIYDPGIDEQIAEGIKGIRYRALNAVCSGKTKEMDSNNLYCDFVAKDVKMTVICQQSQFTRSRGNNYLHFSKNAFFSFSFISNPENINASNS
jgi:hypothetical protein